MKARETQLLRSIPDILDCKTILYIGISQEREEILRLFKNKNFKITIIEAWKPNVEALKPKYPDIIWGDITDPEIMASLPQCDIVMWWHGPEHVKKKDLPDLLGALRKKALKFAVVACPWGIYKQGAVKGNPYEKHQSYLYPDFFRDQGWMTSVIGQKNVRGSNLIAWTKV
jgi:hypothetical protein